MLIISPQGGLANRMRVIASALQVAAQASVGVKCIWDINGDCGASYEQLLEPIEHLSIQPSLKFLPKSTFNRKGAALLRNKIWNKLMCGVDVCLKPSDFEILWGEGDVVSPEVGKYMIPLLRKDKDVYVETCSVFCSEYKVDVFVPVKPLMRIIESFAGSFSSDTYGLHIRRTDNVWAIEHSPIDLFVSKIKSVLAKVPDATFYLASDDVETVTTLKSLFGERIIVRDKDFSRRTESGIRDALIDMWLLSRTKKIFGSYYSSFSEMAAWIGKTRLECLFI